MSHQDMPPPGGFASINVERSFPKPLIRQGIYATILIGLSINGYFFLEEWRKRQKVLRVELNEHFVATAPFLYAEQERNFLKHLRNLREDERDLMKNHKNWKLGTLYGEKVFKTLPKDTIPPVSSIDWTNHRPQTEFQYRVVVMDMHQ